jgi:hypothetical protein
MVAKLTRLTQNSDTIAPSGRELYHLQFFLQAASLENFGYTLIESRHLSNLLCDLLRQLKYLCVYYYSYDI